MSSQASSEPLHIYEISDFKLYNGSTLPKLKLAYKILNPHNSKIAVVQTCFKGRLDTVLTHSNGALKNHKIILIALLGNGESSSPSNTPDLPPVDYMDCMAAQYPLLTQELGINEVDVMYGFSMGGQATYHWITAYPDFIKHAVIVCSSAKTSRHNYQFLEGPKAAFESAKNPELGIMAFSKAFLAWLTSAEWFDQECYKQFGMQQLQDWDDYITIQGNKGWSGEDYMAMYGMWQRADITRCTNGGDLESALKRIKAKVLLMPCQSDQYFRPYVSEREAKSLENATVEIIPSVWGHLGGGGANPKDTDWMDRTIELFLQGSP